MKPATSRAAGRGAARARGTARVVARRRLGPLRVTEDALRPGGDPSSRLDASEPLPVEAGVGREPHR